MKPFFLLVSFFFLGMYSHLLEAQSPAFINGQLLVRTEAESLAAICTKWQILQGKETNLQVGYQVSEPLHIWLLTFDSTSIDAQLLLTALKSDALVEAAQLNHKVFPRQLPDDPYFFHQWYHLNAGFGFGMPDADTDAELAWDLTTGGLTQEGDTIVIAILDDGIDVNHPEFYHNLWRNHQEIPDNGIDDDGNGYIDDYYGWNVKKQNDNIYGGWHGTKVAGVMGAEGNNNEGMAGMNWKVKLMIVKNDFNTDEAKVLQAYSYPLLMRKKYNETAGAKGAYVVATNASWGIDYAKPEDSPLWCAVFDSLGAQGILNCAAASNQSYDIDLLGDLPSSCQSPFLISVTATDAADKRNFSAFGKQSVDLAAPGEYIFTTFKGNEYGFSTGTSVASPLVAGTIGLIYAADCDKLVQLSKSNPASSALLVRKLILENVDTISDLTNKLLSDGRLNAGKALAKTVADCGACLEPDFLTVEQISDKNATLGWLGIGTSEFVLQWRQTNSPIWNSADNVPEPFYLENLKACRAYEFKVASQCADSLTTFSKKSTFNTDGCCKAPDVISVDEVLPNEASISWAPVLAAQAYRLQYRMAGAGNWEELVVQTPSADLAALQACSDYEVRVQTMCAVDSISPLSILTAFSTSGCSGCVGGDYCEINPDFIFSDLEWIEEVNLNGTANISGQDGGYAFFNNPFEPVEIDSSYEISIVPGFSGFNYQEYYFVFIDFNQDGDFDDSDELAFEGGPTNTTAIGNITIPSDAVIGLTRMRIVLSFGYNNSPCPGSLAGEVEDYCLEIIPSVIPCLSPINIDTLTVSAFSAELNWTPLNTSTLGYVARFREVGSTDWTEFAATNNYKKIQGLSPCQQYEFQVRSICANELSAFSNSYFFTTSCTVGLDQEQISLAEQIMEVFPNPFDEVIHLKMSGLTANQIAYCRLYDTQGRMMMELSPEEFATQENVDLKTDTHLQPGMYFLHCIARNGKLFTFKLLKI